MKPFRFSLQSVRVIRERKEQAAQQRYAEMLRQYEQANAALKRTTDELAASWESLCRQVAKGGFATELRQSQAWCAALESRQKDRAEDVKKARYAMEVASRELLTATRGRQAIDKLHDKHRANHAKETQREEQKILDEMGLRASANGELLRGWSAAT